MCCTSFFHVIWVFSHWVYLFFEWFVPVIFLLLMFTMLALPCSWVWIQSEFFSFTYLLVPVDLVWTDWKLQFLLINLCDFSCKHFVSEIVSLIHYQEHFEAFVFNHRIKILFGKTGRNPIKSCGKTKTNSHSFNIHSVAATNHHPSSHFGSKSFVKPYIIKSSSTPKKH